MSSVSVFKKLLQVCCVVTAATFFFTQPAYALDIPKDCSDIEMLQHKWETQYFYDLKFNTYLNFIPELKCGSRTYKFAKAIWVIENIKVSPEFGNIYDQLKTHVKEFQIMPKLGITTPIRANTNRDVGKVSLYLPAFNEPIVKNIYPWSDINYIPDLFMLVATIIHELRHLQAPNFEHVDCISIDLLKGCDTDFSGDIATASPISMEVLFLTNVLENNYFSPSDRSLIQKDITRLRTHFFTSDVSE